MNLKLRGKPEKMVNNGDYELAARTVTGALTQYPDSKELAGLKEKTFLKLKEKYQEFNPFKFIIYSEIIRNETPQLEYPRRYDRPTTKRSE